MKRAFSIAIGAIVVGTLAIFLPSQSHSQDRTAENPARIEMEKKARIDKLNAAGKSFLNWAESERARQPSDPGGYYQKISEQDLCQKANELVPEATSSDGDEAYIVKWPQDAGAGAAPQEEDALSPYFLSLVTKIACQTKELDFYDPRRLQASEGAVGSKDRQSQDGGFPSCLAGPQVTIRHEEIVAIWAIVDAFDHLNRLSFVCIGGKFIENNPDLLSVGFKVRAEEVLFQNSRAAVFSFRDSKISRLKIRGTIAPPVAAPDVSLDTSKEPELSWDSPQTPYPGARVGLLSLARSDIGTVSISGAAVGQTIIGYSTLKGSTTVSRSEVGVFSVNNSKLKQLSLWQVRLGRGSPIRGHGSDYGALHITSNDIEEDLRLGALDDYGSSQLSIMPRQFFDASYGPTPPWMASTPIAGGIQVRGSYSTLALNNIRGQLLLNGFVFDNYAPEDNVENKGTPNDVKEKRSAYLILNKLAADSIKISHSMFRLGPQGTVSGFDMIISKDIELSNNVMHRQDNDNVVSTDKVNRLFPVSQSFPQGSRTGTLVVFNRLKARSVTFAQNLMMGGIFLAQPELGSFMVSTIPSNDESNVPWHHYCAEGLPSQPPKQVGLLQGGISIETSAAYAASIATHPACYGSVVIAGGAVDTIVASGLLSDLLVNGSRLKFGLNVSGRVSGIVNLANIFAKDGIVSLGTLGRPLLWCQSGQLIMDGMWAAALQADRDSFQRYDCDRGKPSHFEPLQIGMRTARIDQITGGPRVTIDDKANSGLLGLDIERLIDIAGPRVSQWTSVSSADRRQAKADFDPQTLSLLATRLRESGYVAEANRLSMERVSRQKWISEDPLDRLKWLLGWPVGWGYQTELAFIYALFFVFGGAWVSAYYREYPDNSPPNEDWLKIQQMSNASQMAAPRLRKATIRIFQTVLAIGLPLLTVLWLPDWLSLSPNATLLAVAAIVAALMVLYSRPWEWPRAGSRTQQLARFFVAGRHLGYHHFFFSLDRFLPSPGFHSYWGIYPRIGQSGRNYFYLHRLLGLLLISITAAGAVGLFE